VAEPAPTWAGDVSRALANEAPATGSTTLRIFRGAGEHKEFRF
jgi:hypothetical protein